MTPRCWKTISAWTLGATLSLAGLIWLVIRSEQGADTDPSPGFASNVGNETPQPETLPAAKPDAKARAKQWKQECLERFPELQVIGHPLPDEENGFWQLLQLGKQAPVSKKFAGVLEELRFSYQPDGAEGLMRAHQSLVGHIERIADLPGRSSVNLPVGYRDIFDAGPIRQAMQMMLLKACLAAEAGNEAEAYACVGRAQKLIAHLRGIETPNAFIETVSFLGHREIQRVVIREILPRLGPESDPTAWKLLTAGTVHTTPLRLSVVMRGEWHTGADFRAFSLVADAENLGLIADGRACAMAYSAWMAELVRECATARWWDQLDLSVHKKAIWKLPPEQAGCILIATNPIFEWIYLFKRDSIGYAHYQAALELLILEKNQAPLTADSARDITYDPLAGKPFVFDPATRTLDVPESSKKVIPEPIKLPW